ncbi:MAG: hypothetical protein Q8N18_21200 [Opitutaceae bacterium]|nr:hypothetical protein [Opitutaceae bacterium]
MFIALDIFEIQTVAGRWIRVGNDQFPGSQTEQMEFLNTRDDDKIYRLLERNRLVSESDNKSVAEPRERVCQVREDEPPMRM